MKAATQEQEIRQHAGFMVYKLRTDAMEIAVIPELGARIVSLLNKVTGREWMWHPGDTLDLFRNSGGDDFGISTLAGADECIPTIAPCQWEGRDLPDHGEAWSASWELDEQAWQQGQIRTTLNLPVSPLRFERAVSVSGTQVHMRYVLTNRGAGVEKFLWAFHPLLRIYRGDRLVLPSGARNSLHGAAWLDDVASMPDGGCSKLFVGPLQECRAGVSNDLTGDSLEFHWTGAGNNMLGLWLTHGGWNGFHHLAIEPTNGAPDALADAARDGRCGVIEAGQSLAWQITIKVHNNHDQNLRNSAVLPQYMGDRAGSPASVGFLTGHSPGDDRMGNRAG